MAAASAASEAERYRQFEAAEAQRRAEYDAAEVRRQAEWAAGEADRLRAIAQWEAEMREWQRDEEARVAAAAVAVRAAREAMEQRVRAVEERRASAERAAAERGGEAAGSENRPFTVSSPAVFACILQLSQQQSAHRRTHQLARLDQILSRQLASDTSTAAVAHDRFR